MGRGYLKKIQFKLKQHSIQFHSILIFSWLQAIFCSFVIYYLRETNIDKLFFNLKYSFSPNCENESFSRAISNDDGNDMEINWQVIEKITSNFPPEKLECLFRWVERRRKSFKIYTSWRILVDSSQIHSRAKGRESSSEFLAFLVYRSLGSTSIAHSSSFNIRLC